MTRSCERMILGVSQYDHHSLLINIMLQDITNVSTIESGDSGFDHLIPPEEKRLKVSAANLSSQCPSYKKGTSVYNLGIQYTKDTILQCQADKELGHTLHTCRRVGGACGRVMIHTSTQMH